MRSRVALVALALLCMGQGYNVPFHPRAAPAGGGPTVAFDDDFESDITGWTGFNSSCSSTGGYMRQSSQGVCIYDGAQTEGSQVSSRDSWMILESDSASVYVGPMLRHKGSDSSGSEYSYAMRHNGGGVARFRVCDGAPNEGDCSDFHAFTQSLSTPAGWMIAMAVAGETTATQFCGWFWDAGDAPSQGNMDDPTAWGYADRCVSTDGTIDNAKLDGLHDCGGSTTCDTWDSDPSSIKGYPAAGQTTAQTYKGATGDVDWERVVAGEL